MTDIEKLNTTLCDEIILYQKLRNFHWNIEGNLFSQLHELFEKQYAELEGQIDIIAETIRSHDEKAIGKLTEVLSTTRLSEPEELGSQLEMVQELADDNDRVVVFLQKDIKDVTDPGIEDLLIQLLNMHKKMAWMLRSTVRS